MQLWQLKIPLHETWHFTTFCGGIVAGLALSLLSFAELFSEWQWMLTGAVLFLFVWWRRWRWLVFIAMAAGMLVGLSRGAIDVSSRGVYGGKYGAVVTITGRVAEDPDTGTKGEKLLRLSDIRTGEERLPAQVWATVPGDAVIERSDIVTLNGRLAEGFGSFGASMYRASIVGVERPQPGDVALHVRESFGEKVRLGIEEPAASLAMGYLTGQRRSLPEELDTALKAVGLTHVVVASGYNLTILVRAMKRLFEKRSRFLAVFMSAVLVICFIAVTGLSPSMARAGLVTGLALAAWYFGRKFHPVTMLVFAAALTGFYEPSYVWGNLGWQLSFAAFGGVMVLAPLLQNYFFGNEKPGWIRQVLGETVSAQIATAPLILYSFGHISNVAVIANLLVLPLIPLAMLLTFMTGLVGYIIPGAIGIAAMPAQWLLSYMVGVAQAAASVGWAQTTLALPLWAMVMSFALIIGAIIYLKHSTRYNLRDANVIE